jgi:hypothetical protein
MAYTFDAHNNITHLGIDSSMVRSSGVMFDNGITLERRGSVVLDRRDARYG